MKRFVIRNYGPSRQFTYKKLSICLSNDRCIETNDASLAAFFETEDQITVTDRGAELAPNEPTEAYPTEAQPADPNEISYDGMEVVELKALCKDRHLKTKGLKKGGLIEVLEEYDSEEVLEEIAVE